MKIYQLLIAFIIGFLACIFWKHEPIVPPDPDIVQYKRQFIEVLHKRHEGKISRLERINDSLRGLLKQNHFMLLNAKKRAKNAKKKLSEQVEIIKSDSACKAKGDSLEVVTADLFREMDSTESLYARRINFLENIVAVKDSELVFCQSNYSDLKYINEQQLLREQQLTKNLETAFKSQQKKIREHKLLAGGMLFLSGIATVLYINARE